MKPQLIFIHGGDAYDTWWQGFKSYLAIGWWKLTALFKEGSEKWPDTLATELEGWEVLRPKMPSKYNAKYEKWAQHFEAQLPQLHDGVVLVGWSLGANFLAKYLSRNDLPVAVKEIHLVAGCYGLGGGFWLPKNFPGKLGQYSLCLYHSQDDFVVPFSDFERYKAALPKAKAHVFKNRNHFLQPDFPELVETLKELR